MADITKYGPQDWRDLQKENSVGTEGLIPLEELTRLRDESMSGRGGVPSIDLSESVSYGADTPMGNWGTSRYDEEIANAPMSEGEIQDMRYENQPWYDTLANGIGKMLGTAGTTFVSSLVGLPYGLYEAANQGRWSALWDNDVTQGLADVDKWLEENMTNYRSQVQQNSPWYSPDNLFSMNFIADDIIKNAGFTLGAAASMAVGSGSMGLMSKALGFVNDVSKGAKMGQAALSSLFAATGEGMIEARQGVEERNKLEMQRLDDAFAPERQALELEFQQIEQEYAANRGQSLVMGPDGRAVDPAYEKYKRQMTDLSQKRDLLNQRYEAGKQQIEESGQDMGNVILLANQALLTAGNLIQFGKGMVKSFDSARHAAEISSKAAKPLGVRATKAGTDLLRTGYKITGKNFGKAVAATKGLLTEGSEEMNQQWIQSGAGAYYDREDVNDYWKAKLDPEATKDTTEGLYTLGRALDRGFDESWGDVNQWEQFVIGGITGMAGSYSPTKLFNQDKTKGRLDPRRYGSWEGGAYNELRNFNQKYSQYEENINEVNKILQSEDFPNRVLNMVGHTYTESEKNTALDEDDKKSWKDADDKQMVHDIQSFLRAGKLDDLRAIYNEVGSNLSDEDIDNVFKSTTKKISAEEDKQNHDRWADEQMALMDSEEQKANMQIIKDSYVGQEYYEGAYVDRDGNHLYTNDEMREELKHNAEELNRKVDSYLDSVQAVNEATKGALSKDQEDNLVYLHNLGREKLVRADKIIADKRKQMPSKFLLKTEKSPEQLTKEYASSDLVFSKDENTKEGYVEVDTSLMDNTSFRNFFVRDLLWGGNIMPEFGETADERAAREEEEKNLSEEEKKKKARERASKKWQNAMEKMQMEAQEQRNANGELMEEYFRNLYNKKGTTNKAETDKAVNDFFKDIIDASTLISDAGEYDKVLKEYMENPSLVDKDKEKEETKAEKAAADNAAKNKFVDKSAVEIKQDIANGDIDLGEFDAFINDGGLEDESLINAQQKAKKAQEGNQKAAALKQHILESDATPEVKEIAMTMVDQANIQAENPEDINMSAEALQGLPLDMVTPNANITDITALELGVQDVLANAFNGIKEDENAQNDIPESSIMSDSIESAETGHDATTKVEPEVVAPVVSSPSKATSEPLPKNPLTEGAITMIINATSALYDRPNKGGSENGIWRSCTTRNIYGKSTGTYHESITDKNSIRYKRSKAIWDYLNSIGAFDRLDDSSNDRIKEKDAIHFMVKNMSQEIYNKDYSDLTEEEKPYALVILMLSDETKEVLGDLPLAQFEVDYGNQKENSQLAHLISLQDKVFKAFDENYKKTGNNEAVVDNMTREGADNLNLIFDSSKKPLVSQVKQVMKGVVPYRYGEINTLNEVANEQPFELGVAVTGTTVAKKRGDKAQHKEIVMPHVGNTGQPYLLLPTPSGEQIAVPFYMKPFDANQHRETEFYKILSNAMYSLLSNNSYTTSEQKEAFNKAIDVIEGLLQVKAQEGVRTVVVSKDNVTFNFQSLTDPNKKITLSAPNASGNAFEIVKMLVDQLSGTSINVSLQFLNDTIEAGGRKVNYNNVIGEIADVNLPKGTNHTVNGWFTIELAPSAGIKPSKKVTPKTTGVISETIGGRNIEINTDTLVAYDPTTGEVILDNEEVNLRLAQIKAAKPHYKDKDRVQVSINGELRTYDIKQNKFVKNAPVEKTTEATEAQLVLDEDNPTPSPEAASLEIQPQTSSQPRIQVKAKEKTLEQIEDEMKQKKIVGRQTKDAWDAIPDNLKLKLVNEGTSIMLAYKTGSHYNSFIISLSNRENFIRILADANMAAKAGNLIVSEAAKPMEKSGATIQKENEQAARRWLAKNLPSLSSEERTQFVEKLSRMGNDGGKYWGSYRSGVIQIQKNAPMGTIYHEAFHYVLDMVLSPEERQQILDIAKEEYGLNDNWMAEERLANDFRRYAMDENAEGFTGKLRRFFRKLIDKITRYNRISDATINQLFWKINNGELAQKSMAAENFEDNQQRVLREIRNVQKEKLSWKNLSTDTKKALISSGLSEATYNGMSLEEKDQYVKCRG